MAETCAFVFAAFAAKELYRWAQPPPLSRLMQFKPVDNTCLASSFAFTLACKIATASLRHRSIKRTDNWRAEEWYGPALLKKDASSDGACCWGSQWFKGHA